MQTTQVRNIAVLLLLGILLAAVPASAQSPDRYARELSAARDMLGKNADSAVAHARRATRLAGNETQQAEARELYGEALRLAGDLTAAEVEYGLLLTQAQDRVDEQLRGRALNGLGVVKRSFQQFDLALGHHAEAFRLFDSLGNVAGAAQALHDLAQVLVDMGRTDEAMDLHLRALVMRMDENKRPGIAESHNSIGLLYCASGQPDSALNHFREALSLRKQLGVFSPEVAATLMNMGMAYRMKGEAQRALEYFRESLGLSRNLGSEMLIASTRKEMGAAFRELGDYVRAREALDAASTAARRLRLAGLSADILLEQAEVEERAGNPSRALSLLRRHQALRDSLSLVVSSTRMLQAEGGVAGVRRNLAAQDAADEQQSDFMIFLIVVIVLLAGIAVIALSALRLRGRTNRELSGKNAEIQHMNVELQRLNDDLTRSEEKYRLLFERLPVGVFLYNSEMTLLKVNEAFSDIIGTPREKLEGLNLGILRDRRILPALTAAIEGKGGAYEGEYKVSTNNNVLQVSIRTAPVRTRDLPVPHGIGFVLDIGNWKRIEHDLIESREIAVQADRLKNAFLTNISHEIRTPLNIIMGYFGLLHQEMIGRIDDDEADYFMKVDVAVRRLLRTVDQILSLSILESGSYAINLEQCDLHAMAAELIEELRPLAGEKGLDVRFTATCREAYVNIDRYSVTQALRNLLDNAVKFTDTGTIDMELGSAAGHVSFVIRDTGIGMAPEFLHRLFEAFSQEDFGYSRSYEGLGLGLRLTKRYLDVNAGSIQVESEKGKGTTFTVTFPLTQHYSHTAPAPEPEKAEDETPGPRRTLLVVEDDHETQKFLQLILASSFDLHFADSADDAWDTLHRTAVDLVLMDISLRGDEDGLQLTGRIRRDEELRKIPVIAVTAHAFADDRRRSLEAGCDEYLPKPFRVNQLRELVDRFLK